MMIKIHIGHVYFHERWCLKNNVVYSNNMIYILFLFKSHTTGTPRQLDPLSVQVSIHLDTLSGFLAMPEKPVPAIPPTGRAVYGAESER